MEYLGVCLKGISTRTDDELKDYLSGMHARGIIEKPVVFITAPSAIEQKMARALNEADISLRAMVGIFVSKQRIDKVEETVYVARAGIKDKTIFEQLLPELKARFCNGTLGTAQTYTR